MPDAPGQKKLHTVRDAAGNLMQMTQEDWINRDKNAGLVRVDDDGNDIPEPPEPTTEG